MKITVNRVVNSANVLRELANTKLSFGLSYKLKKITDECAIIIENFEKQRTELLNKYAVPDEDGTQFTFNQDEPEKLETFNKVIEELATEEIDLDIKEISLSDFIAEKDLTIEPGSLALISWFIKE